MKDFKLLKRMFFIGTIILVLTFIITEALIINEGRRKYAGESDYILVLGAGVFIERPSPRLLDRINECVRYANSNKNAKIILSGGKGRGERITEAQAMETFLVRYGIKRDRIIKEEKAGNTFENLKYTKQIIDEIDSREDIKLTIITADFHMFRSKFLAKRLGFEVEGIPAETNSLNGKLKYYTREFAAFFKSLIFDRG